MTSFRQYNDRIEGKDAQVLGISCDSPHSHRAWATSMGGLPYPLVSDFHPHGGIAESFGVWHADRGTSLRAVIIVDKGGIVRYKQIYPQGIPNLEDILSELDKLG